MRLPSKLPWLALAALLAAGAAFAQEAAEAPAEVVEVVSGIDSGDTAWMLTSTLLVLFMILPGLALFYGGLVRAKNMLSVLMQCTLIASVVMIVYVLYGYSMSFGGGEGPFWGGLAPNEHVLLPGATTPDTRSHRPASPGMASTPADHWPPVRRRHSAECRIRLPDKSLAPR